MKISDIILEAPIEKLGQKIGQGAFNVGKTAGKVAAKITPNDSTVRAVKQGVGSGIMKWATGSGTLEKNKVSSRSNYQTLIQGIIDQSQDIDSQEIAEFRKKINAMNLHWSLDKNVIDNALAQAIENKPLDVNQINELKKLQSKLKKV